MRKLSLSVHDSSREKLIIDLQKAGCLHISLITAPEDETAEPSGLSPVGIELEDIENQIAELEDVIGFIEGQVPHPKVGLLKKLSAVPPTVTYEKMGEVYRKFNLAMNLREVKNIEKKFKDAQNRLLGLLKEKEDLILWKDSGIDLDVLNGKSPFVEGISGYIPKSEEEQIVEKIKGVSRYVEVFRAFESPGDVYLYIVFLKTEKNLMIDSLRDLGFAPITLSARVGDIQDAVEKIDDEIVIVSGNIEIYRSFIVDYSDYLDKFRIIYDYLLIKRERLEGEAKGMKTVSVSHYLGWFPKREEKRIRAILDTYSDIDYTVSVPAGEDAEQVPVMIKNSFLAKPFESITGMYGNPVYGHSPDATAHITPFYFIFYGICLGDFGYGLFMLLVFGFLGIVARKNPGTSRFMALLALGGLSSMIFGILTGSFFGDLFAVYIRIDIIASAGLISPMKSPLLVLYFSLILGAIHLLYGITLNMINMMKTSVVDAIFEKFSWIVFLCGFFGWAIFSWITEMVNSSLASLTPQTGNWIVHVPTLDALGMNIIVGLMLGGMAMIMINSFRKGKKTVGGFIVSFFGGLYSLYGTSAFVSDLLSYARLLALGLSGGIIANVFNMLVFMMKDSMPGVVGWIVAIPLLIFSHLFNLTLSAFGAFVHAMRLQFVEFFSKFMEAGGASYTPLREEGVYYKVTHVKEENKI
ncbi:MAG: hypothetical protein A2Y33_14510 [Spirochaetes bacterium GWF1_51_8]|nr:MAG: hypothetical protein A2Y33_14510 [Spirochaetes bacterium GWF1_51_8]